MYTVDRFEKYFWDFGQRNGFLSRCIHIKRDMNSFKAVYERLFDWVKAKACFAPTTLYCYLSSKMLKDLGWVFRFGKAE